ncbi:MAG: 3-methyl-2-oxobutanoate hydroxymethyltransferase [Candidatus Hodarchaeota archaeon]
MSLQKVTAKKLIEKKKNGEKIVTITSYDYSFAKIVDESGIDLVLVGDSLAMVVLGYKNTLSVTMDEMIHHTKAVSKAVKNALIVGDMPFLSYKVNKTEAVKNAGRFIQEGGAEAVKVEGGTEICPTIKRMIDADIQVMGHIGLTPQAIYQFGGFLVQGKTVDAAKKLILDAVNLEKTGVFSIVLESIPWQIAKLITSQLKIPTIGIGAGSYCDGQILVIHDMLGIFTEIKPKFLKYFGDIGKSIRNALELYKKEVNQNIYPDLVHSYEFPSDDLNEITQWLNNVDFDKEL